MKYRKKQDTLYCFEYRHSHPFKIFLYRYFKILPKYKNEEDKNKHIYGGNPQLPPGTTWALSFVHNDVYRSPFYYLISVFLFKGTDTFSWLLRAARDLD